MRKYSAVLEISRFLCMADDVTRVKYVVVRIFYIFHTKLEIHKFDFLTFIFIILYENMKLYGKNTEKFENGIRNLKKLAEILVFGILRDVIIPGLGQNRLICLSSRRIRQKWQNFASRVSLGWRIQKRNQFSHILSICPSEWRHHDQI